MMVETEIMLGDEVKCKYTGVQGIAMERTEYVNGCIQFSLAMKFDKSKPLEQAISQIGIDSQSLIIVKKGERHKKKDLDEKEKPSIGGAMRMTRRTM